jgi:hypothetical protein
MATALDLITLAEAKAELKVDFDANDALITRLIHTAVALIEQRTNHMLYPRTELRRVRNGYELYDYPATVSNLVSGNAYTLDERSGYSVFELSTSEVATLELGYATKEEVPAPLIEACYKLITYLYEHRDAYKAEIPSDIYLLIRPFQRYATI